MEKRGESMQKTEYEIPSPVNCTIALVTDLHEYDPESVLEILREVKPDVIAVAGDTLERHHRGENLDKGDKSLASRLVCAGIRTAENPCLLDSCISRISPNFFIAAFPLLV